MRTRPGVVALVAVVLWVAAWVFGLLTSVSAKLESFVAAALTTTPSFAIGNEFVIVCGDWGWTEVGTGEAMGLALLLLAGPPLAAVAMIARRVPSRFLATPRVGTGIHIALIVQHASLVSGALPLLAMFEVADVSIEGAAFVAVFLLHGALNIAAIGTWRDVQLQVPQCPSPLRAAR